jgi:hypothetical protein
MSTADPVKDGTFELLDDLQEEGRLRFIKRRSKAELEAIVAAAWRERDELRVQKDVLRGYQIKLHIDQMLTIRYLCRCSSAA